jgi:hypothetical protein
MRSDFIELFSSSIEDQIAFVKSILDSAGIPFIIRGDSHAGISHAVISTQIWVKKEDVQKTKDLLKELF